MSLDQNEYGLFEISSQINKMNSIIVSNITQHAVKFDDGQTIHMKKKSFDLSRFLSSYSKSKGKGIL